MLRIIKGLAIASVVAFLVIVPTVSASAATYPPNTPYVAPAPPTATQGCPDGDAEHYPVCTDPSQDPAALGNAPIGGGRNVSDSPGFAELNRWTVQYTTTTTTTTYYNDPTPRVLSSISLSLALVALLLSISSIMTSSRSKRADDEETVE